MKPWPLERVPHLDFLAVASVLQSIAQEALGRVDPLSFSAKSPREFAAMTWESLGGAEESLHAAARRFAAMFNVDVRPPLPQEETGIFAQKGLDLWQEGQRPLTFFTSGSTGEAKGCTHLESHVRQEIAGIVPWGEGGESMLATVPLHHMYGFIFGVLMPMCLDIPVRCAPPLPTVVDAQMRPKDLVVSTPLLWSRLVEMKNWLTGASDAGRDITIFMAAAPTPPEVMHALRRNSFRTVEFFGSSETGGFCCRENPDEPFVLLPHVERGKGEHEGAIERVLPDGTLMRYPFVDSIMWVGDRALLPGGRLDKAVQVAGVNVHPQHVASVLERHEGVRRCLVRLMREDEGHRLKAFVVPQQGWNEKALRKSLALFARQNLDDAERPGHYAFGDDIPRTPMGKPADWQ
ncbi:MAG: AMP-binding protein [Deltaproteobacteria bacterium]|jgi:4-coumarate--CoA ligase (photoactive yellow protein activation family)|nr:AMP-binding protein [Deltaproteobacteria bacterium]